MIRAGEWLSSRIDTKTICKAPLEAVVDWTNSSSEVFRLPAPEINFGTALCVNVTP